MKANQSSLANHPHAESTTVRPPFDPAEFARQSECKTVPPPPALPEFDPGNASGTIEILVSIEDWMVPAILVAREDLDWFDVAPEARQILLHVDGVLSVREICARSGQPLEEAILLVEHLVRDGVIGFP
jgi:hypothetical protein